MHKSIVEKNEEKMQMIVTRSFDAPLQKVWDAWTKSEMLDKWWAPKPYDAVTKSFSFEPGGKWYYYMKGPEGDQHWCMNIYEEIKAGEYFTATDCFCDEDGNPVTDAVGSNHWRIEFSEQNGVTTVKTTTTFASVEDMKKYLEMGVEQGFDQGLDQLDALITS